MLEFFIQKCNPTVLSTYFDASIVNWGTTFRVGFTSVQIASAEDGSTQSWSGSDPVTAGHRLRPFCQTSTFKSQVYPNHFQKK